MGGKRFGHHLQWCLVYDLESGVVLARNEKSAQDVCGCSEDPPLLSHLRFLWPHFSPKVAEMVGTTWCRCHICDESRLVPWKLTLQRVEESG